MNELHTRKDIEQALKSFQRGTLAVNAKNLLNTLDYESEITMDFESSLAEDFISYFDEYDKLNTERAMVDEWESIDFLFQLTEEEISGTGQTRIAFKNRQLDNTIIESYVFFALKLRENNYTRTQLSTITREINKLTPMPAMILFQHEQTLTLAVIDRRLHKRDESKDVLEKVTLIKDINSHDPHRAHIEILFDLSRNELFRVHGFSNFVELHRAWAKVLDTEELNKQFYQKLFNWFEWAIDKSTFPRKEKRVLKSEEHVIRLITRLLFIWFLKEKGLVADELFNKTQIQGLLAEDDFDNGDSYYRVVLQNLFFATLNTEIDKRGFSTGTNTTHRNFSRYRYKSQMRDSDALLNLFAKTPFINGGLFDCLDSEEATRDGGYRIDCFSDKQYKKLCIPNYLFFDEKRGLLSIFEEYKFTVEENTPIEQEVALDPELLGRVFEHLLAEYNPETREIAENARKETGSYYTPRPIVDYMVDEALVAILSQKCSLTDDTPELWQKQLRYLFDHAQIFDHVNEWFDNRKRDVIVRAISELKILDPAVGSGAFPMGILHKLTLALRRLDPDNRRWEQLQKKIAGKRAAEAFDTLNQKERDAELTKISDTFEHYRGSDFGRKLYLIQNSIFGVDIQSVACQIAKLRFFISLAIEQEPEQDAENFGIKPLPNLETRFIAANTLIGFKEQGMFTNEVIRNLEQELSDNRERHFHAVTRQQKLACGKKDKSLRRELATELKRIGMPVDDAEKIANWDLYDQNSTADWFVSERMFGVPNGFDVVIGNPPYAKSEHVPEDRREELKTYYGWGGDLYDYFIFAGFDLVSEKGIFSYIANDSFVTFSTKRRIRNLFLKNQLIHLVKAPANTFEASIYTAIFVLSKWRTNNLQVYMSGKMDFPDFQYHSNGPVEYTTVHKIPDCKFLLSGENDWVLRFFTLENVERFCFVLDTGIDSGNVRTKIFFKENDGRRHRLLQGKQIQRYLVQWDSPNAKYLFCDVDYQPLPIPGIGRGGKPSKRDEYWKFRGDIENHHQPERLLMRQTDDDLIVAYHSEAESGRFYTDNTLHTILPKSQKTNLKYFLALFNSRLLNFVYHVISQEQGKSQAQVKIKVVKTLPVVVPAEEEQRPIIALADEILSAKATDLNVDTAELEEEIDKRVYALYNLTQGEIAIVEANVNFLKKS